MADVVFVNACLVIRNIETVRNLSGLSVSVPRCKFDEPTQWRRNRDFVIVGSTGV